MGVYGGPQREVSIQSVSGRSLYSPGVVQDGLVLNLDANKFYSYPQSGITWTDISGGGNNGTLTNGPTYNSANGGSIVFDGVNDRITIVNPLLSSTGNWTISSWCNFSTLNANITTETAANLYAQYIANVNNGRTVFRIKNNGSIINKLELILGSSSTYSSQVITGTTTINTNTFYNFVASRNGSIFTIYINGVLEASSTLTGIDITILQSTPEIGGISSGNFGWLNGRVANTQLYNRALSAAEVLQNYNALRDRFFDSDASSYITAVEAADGQVLEPAVSIAINNFVVGCKADGIWSAIKASCILSGARTLAGALVPLVGTAPTNFNFVSGDYNRKTGLVGDGSTKHLNSNRNNNADPQDNQHLSAFVSTANTSSIAVLIGTIGTTGTNGASQVATNTTVAPGQTFFRSRSSESPLVFTATGSNNRTGFHGLSRLSPLLGNVRVSLTTTPFSYASVTSFSATIGVFNNGSTGAFTNARIAFYSIGESLNLDLLDTRVTTMINAFAAAIP